MMGYLPAPPDGHFPLPPPPRSARPGADPGIEASWAAWHAERSPRAREHLIVYYRPLVDRVAGSLVARLPRSVDREDLSSYGTLGLIDAVDRFDPAHGVPFDRYASVRIQGAILDGLRGVAWEPRSVRVRARDVGATRARMEHARGRSVSESEIASEMGVRAADVAKMLGDMHGSATLPLGELDLAGTTGSSYFPVDVDGLRAALAEAVVALPDRERVVFSLYYVEELTLSAIGELLGVSAVRITQIRNDAIRSIQRGLAGR